MDAEQLLTDAAWLSRLALRLADNADDADDIAQDVRIAAWRRAPDESRPMRPWLAKVARDVANMRRRANKRRAEREIGSDETAASPEVLLERARLHQQIVDLVLTLPEPYRGTVLARFVEGRTCASIARSQGIPEATVRGRLKDALDRLRAGLDAKRGDRRAWAALAVAQKGLAVGTKSKAAIGGGALLALLVGGAAIALHGNGSDATEVASAGASKTVRLANRDARPPLSPPAWMVQPGASARGLRGTVTLAGKPVADAAVSLESAATAAGIAPRVVRTDASGAFDFGAQPPASYDLVASAPDLTSAALHVELAAARADVVVELRLAPCEASVIGSVVDASGNAIPRARVMRERGGTNQGPDEGSAVGTDAKGAYRICVPRGDLSLVYAASGYAGVSLAIDARGDTRRDAVLVPEATIDVAVVRDGAPVPNAYVAAIPADWGVDHAPIARATADGEGRAHLAGLLPGTYSLIALVDGAASADSVQAEAAIPAGTATIALVARSSVRGRVVMRGAPIAGVQVWAKSEHGQSSRAFSQADGTFVVDRVPADATYFAAPYRAIGMTKDHDLEVAPLGEIAGRVTRDGAPVADARVCCVRDVRGLEDLTTTDKDGRYAFRGVVTGSYEVGARTTDAAIAATQVALGDGEQKALDLALDRAGAIAGTVVDANRAPVPFAIVEWAGDTGEETHCNADAKGAFRCAGLGAGTFRASVYAAGSHFALPLVGKTAPVVVGEQNDRVMLVVDAPLATIRGRVVDDSGAPIADAQIAALPVTEDAPPVFHSWLRMPATATDENGGFALANVTAGRYAIRARSPLGEVVQVAPSTESVTLTLVRAASLTGTLTGFTSTPQLYARNGGGELEGRVDGHAFSFPHLPAGHYVISATGGDAKPVDLKPGEAATLALVARPAGTIDIALQNFRTHAPLAGAICQAVPTTNDSERGVTPWDLARDPRTDATGHATLTASGSIEIRCMMPAADRWSPPSVHLDVPANGKATAILNSVEVLGDHPGDVGLDFDPLAVAPRIAAVRATGTGLKAGDLVTAVDGAPVANLNAGGVMGLLVSHAPGTTATLTANGRTVTLTAK